MIHQILSWLAVLSGFASAGLWWWAATLVIKKGDPRATGDIFIGGEAVKTTGRLQAQYNAWAAIATGVATAASALTQLISN
jgi:hypothetical protein